MVDLPFTDHLCLLIGSGEYRGIATLSCGNTESRYYNQSDVGLDTFANVLKCVAF